MVTYILTKFGTDWFVFVGARVYVNKNKRAMMALDRTPESFAPQNEFYLLYYYCSNLWPPGWGQFWPQGYHMNRIDKGAQGDATYQKSKL